MLATILEILVVPIIVGMTVALFTYWLNDRDQ
ncbi:MAG TPA: type I toxin-antitoxin system Fst family toxin [Candidatus Dormibacteraeota bacterium]|nr:type I toxin-antitoxin system Fst family toxin [Candidatus Dormibacteraeota bacterium]